MRCSVRKMYGILDELQTLSRMDTNAEEDRIYFRIVDTRSKGGKHIPWAVTVVVDIEQDLNPLATKPRPLILHENAVSQAEATQKLEAPHEAPPSLPMPRGRFLLILAVILLLYGMGFLILAGSLQYEGPAMRWHLTGRAVGSMLYILFLGTATGGLLWAGRRFLGRNRSGTWHKPILWGTGFWAVTTLFYRLNILLAAMHR
ncbi:MAG: hypothetical protein H7833_06275 [Magnetococcus sp. DMHC-1]